MVSILLAGAFGKMGRSIQNLIGKHPHWSLDAVLVSPNFNKKENIKVPIFRNLNDIKGNYDVWIDVTNPKSVYINTLWAINHHISPIIGTSGLDNQQVKKLQEQAFKKHIRGIIAPNFSISAVLMMYFSKISSRFISNASIVEIHHPDKLDSPSGTAKATAGILNSNGAYTKNIPNGIEGDEHKINDVAIFSQRKKGYLAYQSVNFSGNGETLKISQNSFSRKSFMAGVELAINKVKDQKGLVLGLEKVMGLN